MSELGQPSELDVCQAKRQYRTEREARYVARKCGMYYYLCPVCYGYHLTCTSSEEYRKRKEWHEEWRGRWPT